MLGPGSWEGVHQAGGLNSLRVLPWSPWAPYHDSSTPGIAQSESSSSWLVDMTRGSAHVYFVAALSTPVSWLVAREVTHH